MNITREEVSRALVDRINGFEAPANWDEEGAAAITKDACKAAIDVALMANRAAPTLPEPQPAASALGAISLYWRVGTKHFTIRVFSSDMNSVFFQENDSSDLSKRHCDTRPASEVVSRLAAFLA